MRLLDALYFCPIILLFSPISAKSTTLAEPSKPLPRAVSIYAWPLSDPKPQELAQISYNPSDLSTAIKSYTQPKLSSPSQSDIVRVGFVRKDTGSWSGVVTSPLSFEEDVHKKFTLHVDNEGNVYHIGFAAWRTPLERGAKSSSGNGSLVAVVEKPAPGPQPHLNKPVVLNQEGKVDEKEPEKSFLQKYWWAIVFVLLVQVVLGGAKE